MNELAAWILARDDFAVIPHISPDGDAIGSALALNHALERLSKRSVIVCPDEPPRMYAFVKQIERVKNPQLISHIAKWLIFVDVAAPDRAGDVWTWSENARGTAVIDHHETNSGFCDVNCIEAKASSTGELVAKLYAALNLNIDANAAEWLYMAIATDTGNFSYSCTTPDALRITASLLERGLALDKLNEELFHTRTLSRTLLLGKAIGAAVLKQSGRVVQVGITRQMFEESDSDYSETEGIVSYLREIEGVSVALMGVEYVGETKVSLRSDGSVHVGELAQTFGGGGHERAAGLTVQEPLDEALDRVYLAIEQRLS